jgi:inosine-uridine nucleoside N-ribohydrolase
MTLIIDTDMGFDDVLAIAMLNALDTPIAGITTVTGLAHPDQGARNMLALLERMGHADIPVAVGSASPLKGKNTFPQEWCIEAEALAGINLPSSQKTPHPQAASPFIAEMVAQHPGNISILCLGPLTNIALALQEGGPSFTESIKRLVMMGGAVRVMGNVEGEPDAEWNIFIDPAAAAQVFASGIPITMIGLDVTNQAPCTGEFVSKARRITAKNEAGKLIQETLDKMYGYFFDPVTAACVLEPSIVSTESLPIRVTENGKTHEHTAGQSIDVGLGLDFARFQEILLGAIGP